MGKVTFFFLFRRVRVGSTATHSTAQPSPAPQYDAQVKGLLGQSWKVSRNLQTAGACLGLSPATRQTFVARSTPVGYFDFFSEAGLGETGSEER